MSAAWGCNSHIRAIWRSHSALICSGVHVAGCDGEDDGRAVTPAASCSGCIAARKEGAGIAKVSACKPETDCAASVSSSLVTPPSTTRRIGPPTLIVETNASTPSPDGFSGFVICPSTTKCRPVIYSISLMAWMIPLVTFPFEPLKVVGDTPRAISRYWPSTSPSNDTLVNVVPQSATRIELVDAGFWLLVEPGPSPR